MLGTEITFLKIFKNKKIHKGKKLKYYIWSGHFKMVGENFNSKMEWSWGYTLTKWSNLASLIVKQWCDATPETMQWEVHSISWVVLREVVSTHLIKRLHLTFSLSKVQEIEELVKWQHEKNNQTNPKCETLHNTTDQQLSKRQHHDRKYSALLLYENWLRNGITKCSELTTWFDLGLKYIYNILETIGWIQHGITINFLRHNSGIVLYRSISLFLGVSW